MFKMKLSSGQEREGMLTVGEGVSEVGSDTPYFPRLRPTRGALVAMWSEALPMTASCLSSIPVFETLLRYERMMPLMWDQAAD